MNILSLSDQRALSHRLSLIKFTNFNGAVLRINSALHCHFSNLKILNNFNTYVDLRVLI